MQHLALIVYYQISETLILINVIIIFLFLKLARAPQFEIRMATDHVVLFVLYAFA